MTHQTRKLYILDAAGHDASAYGRAVFLHTLIVQYEKACGDRLSFVVGKTLAHISVPKRKVVILYLE